MRRPPAPEDFTSPVHDRTVVARLGVWLGTAFAVCFVTGIISHLHQNPLPWLTIPPDPAWAYRVTQGVHVASGVAALPLLLAKMFAAYPRLFERPAVGSPVRMLERGSIAVLVAAALLEVTTGIANVAQWYVFRFGFTRVHWALAWVAIGALVVHIAVKLPVIRAALGEPVSTRRPEPSTDDLTDADQDAGGDRRWFVRGALAVAAGAVALTAGQSVRVLEPLAVLAPRHPRRSPLGVPVNRTAAQAGVAVSTDETLWRVRVTGPSGSRELGYDDLLAMPQTTVRLPMACVEGWSVDAEWSGVRIRDLVALVGGTGDADLDVRSAETRGAYRRSVLPAQHARHPDTLLALTLAGRRLTPDHGFPVRLIAPGRPGVLQTKWVDQIVVPA